MRRLASDHATLLLLIIAIGGLAAVVLVPSSSRLATAIGAAAAILAAASFASGPDWDALSDEIRRIRITAEQGAQPLTPANDVFSPYRSRTPVTVLVASMIVLVAAHLARLPGRRR